MASQANMHPYIILLRGIMPTGKNKIVMADLKKAVENAGFSNVSTYRNTGNIICTSHLDSSEIQQLIHQTILTKLGVDVEVFVKTPEEIRHALNSNPFPESYPISRVFYNFLQQQPPEGHLTQLLQMDFGEDEIKHQHPILYSFIPVDASKSKLNNAFLEKQTGVRMTARNFNTLSALLEKAEKLD
ncbi:MAG: DUF1697 domain-containing protein [Weeksellaceae bacterium]|nr:DUF1697 domain-containing protein [Weeksellaceae bacterium]